MISNVLKGPWQYKAETINKEGSLSSYKTMNYFLAKEKQELAYKAGVYLTLFILNNDFNRTFLILSEKIETEAQINNRSPEYIDRIKSSL